MRVPRLAIAMAALLCAAGPTAVRAEEVRVTYVAGGSIYIDAGREHGLAPGDRLQAFRDGEEIAVLTVTEVSTSKASCSVSEGGETPAIGDTVKIAPARSEDVEKPVRKRNSGPGIRGRVGVQFLAVRDGTGDYGDYTQPAFDLRVDGANLGGSPWGFFVDARARRTYRSLSDGGSDDDGRTRVYRLAVEYGGNAAPWSIVAGRQYSPSLANVSIFDGISGAFGRERWSVGLFTGSQPDQEDFGYDTELREHGLYFEYRSAASAPRSWSITTGVVGSYASSEINREFAYVQGRYRGGKLLAYLVQEIDVNREWKKDEAGENSLEATSTLVSLRYRASDSVDLFGGFDNRRQIRLLRDRETPITEFDDDFRQGYWAGTSIRFSRHLSLSVDGRFRGGDDAGESEAYTARFGAGRLTRRNLGVHLRTTRYTNPRVDGWLYAVDAGLDLASRVYLLVEAGLRDEQGDISSFLDDSLLWLSAEVDISIGRRWYLLVALEQTSGDLEEYGQLFTRLSYRF